MGRFGTIVARLRKEERQLEKQLTGIRSAISSLEFGSGGGVPRTSLKRNAGGSRKGGRRKLSAAEKRAISARMRKYWAARKRAKA
jgi:hypothetical protein